MLPLEWQDYPPYYIRMGVTAENQEMADKRILELLLSWQGKNFVSYEPALSHLNIKNYLPASLPLPRYEKNGKLIVSDIDWIICGDESGTNARPMDIEWARSVRDQCQAADVPFFLKQIVVDGKLVHMPKLDGKVWDQFPEDA